MEKIRATNEMPIPQRKFDLESSVPSKSGYRPVTETPRIVMASNILRAVSAACKKPISLSLEGRLGPVK
jgi:hypothetical protein